MQLQISCDKPRTFLYRFFKNWRKKTHTRQISNRQLHSFATQSKLKYIANKHIQTGGKNATSSTISAVAPRPHKLNSSQGGARFLPIASSSSGKKPPMKFSKTNSLHYAIFFSFARSRRVSRIDYAERKIYRLRAINRVYGSACSG